MDDKTSPTETACNQIEFGTVRFSDVGRRPNRSVACPRNTMYARTKGDARACTMRYIKKISFLRKLVPALLTITVLAGADKDRPKFSPGPASSFESKQTSNGVTIAAVAYDTEELAGTAFGKMNPYAHGVLPVLFVIQNDSGKTIKLDQMQVEYITPDRERIEATPAREVPFLHGPKRPSVVPSPIPSIPGVSRNKKGPLGGWEIEGRAFTPRMLPNGEAANGFFYFQTGHRKGSKVYITGLQETPSGKELLYFEIPLDTH